MAQKIQANNLKKRNTQWGTNPVPPLNEITQLESSRTNMLLRRVHTKSIDPMRGNFTSLHTTEHYNMEFLQQCRWEFGQLPSCEQWVCQIHYPTPPFRGAVLSSKLSCSQEVAGDFALCPGGVRRRFCLDSPSKANYLLYGEWKFEQNERFKKENVKRSQKKHLPLRKNS